MSLSTREPLIVRGAIVAAVTALIHVAVVLGWLPIDVDAEAAVAGAVDLIGTAVLVVWTRGKVTPVEAPALPAASFAEVALLDDPDEDDGPRHRA